MFYFTYISCWLDLTDSLTGSLCSKFEVCHESVMGMAQEWVVAHIFAAPSLPEIAVEYCNGLGEVRQQLDMKYKKA